MKRFVYFLFVPALMLLTGCPANNEVIPDPVPSAADSVAVNFSGLEPMGIADILDSDLANAVTRAQDGSLMLSFAGEAQSVAIPALSEYDGGASVRRYCNYPISYTFDLGARPVLTPGDGEFPVSSLDGTVDLAYRYKTQTIYLAGLPEHLLSLSEVELSPESIIDVKLSLTNPWFVGGTVCPSFSVDMRHFFGAAEAQDGILTFDAELSSANGWSQTKSFHLVDVVFDPANFDAKGHKLKLDAAIGLSGSVLFSGITTTASRYAGAPDRLGLLVTVVLRDMAVSSVTGTFDFSANSASYDVPLTGLATKGTQLLDLTGGKLTVAAIGGMPAACEVSTVADALVGSRSLAKASGLSFMLPAGDEMTQAWGDFGAASSEEMAVLLSKAFDKIGLKSTVAFDKETVCTVPVGVPYSVSMVPMFECPVIPKAGYVVDVRDTVMVPTGIAAALSEGDVRLVGEVSNSLPIEVNVSVQGYGDSGSSLVGPLSFSVPAEGSLVIDEVVKNRVGSSISGLSYFVVSGKGVFGESSRALRADDGIKADIGFIMHK